jgi:hypothetical protein
MTTAGKSKMLVLLVIVLLLTNVAMLYYLLKNNSEEKKTRDEKQVEYMRKELRLDESQLHQYISLRAKRDSVMAPLNESLRESKMKMIGYLRQPAGSVPDSVVKATAEEISDKQKEIEFAFYEHFRRIQAICKPDQIPLFDSVLIKMVNRTTNKPEPKK